MWIKFLNYILLIQNDTVAFFQNKEILFFANINIFDKIHKMAHVICLGSKWASILF